MEEKELQAILSLRDEMSKEVKTIINTLEDLSGTSKKVEDKVDKLGKTTDKAGKKAKESISDWQKLRKELKEISGINLENISNLALGLSTTGIGTMTAAAALGLDSSINQRPFSSSLYGKSNLDKQSYKNTVISSSNLTGVDVNELYQSLGYGASKYSQDIFKEYSDTVSKLKSISPEIDLVTITRTMDEMYAITNKSFTEIGDVIAYAFKVKGQDGIDYFEGEVGELLNMSKNIGTSFDEMISIFMTGLSTGLEGSEITTGINTVLSTISSELDSGNLKLDGHTALQSYFDAGNSLKDLFNLISNSDIIPVEDTEARALVTAITSGYDEINADIQSTKGLLQGMFKDISNDDAFELSQALNDIKNSLIEVGQNIIEWIIPYLPEITNFFEWLTTIDPSIFVGIVATMFSIGIISTFIGKLLEVKKIFEEISVFDVFNGGKSSKSKKGKKNKKSSPKSKNSFGATDLLDLGLSVADFFLPISELKNAGTIGKVAGKLLKRHSYGLVNVPKNDYVARLHEGERVLTKQEALNYNKGQSVSIAKLADTLVVREEADIDKITRELLKKIKKTQYSMG